MACMDMTTTLAGMLMDNMDRLGESTSKSASILEDLFAKDNEGFEDIKAFTEDKADKYAALMEAPADTGVEVPAVPD